jgi:hypothetical protein
MTSPFRDQHFRCPFCGATLRPFQTRLVCDACGGMQLTQPDLHRAIDDLAIAPSTLRWLDGHGSGATCPQCPVMMAACHIEIELDDAKLHPKVELARCPEHGPWFGKDQLSDLFVDVERQMHKGRPTDGLPTRRWISKD